jgi:hypothetical protein
MEASTMRWMTVVAEILGVSMSAQVEEAARAPIVVPGIADAVDAGVGDHFFVVALKNATVVSWGYNNKGQLGVGRAGQSAGSGRGQTMGFVGFGVCGPLSSQLLR